MAQTVFSLGEKTRHPGEAPFFRNGVDLFSVRCIMMLVKESQSQIKKSNLEVKCGAIE